MKIPDRTDNIAATPASTKYTPVKKFEQKLHVGLVISERGISEQLYEKLYECENPANVPELKIFGPF
ncbi:hypothetical protein BpHYR1_025531 [Brachionus plicatilis]|uniref:Uncharacterized protein n=1 Tax=Brachionus plicatilis TaxID=10195 RepID=A0A3M7SBJ0_BRAPC|nr:hypothetical protein BpHYR1_025531 [Brachionus plicatilis]